MISELLKQTNNERELAYEVVLSTSQALQEAQAAHEQALWDHQMLVSKIGIMIEQLKGERDATPQT